MFDTRTEDAIAQVTRASPAVFGTDLVSLALYGSAAGEDFVPGQSDLNFAIVLERLTFAHLKALHQHLPKWHKLGAATPLLLDRRWIERSRDVFPMEFHDIKAQHRVLFGEEVFATLAIDAAPPALPVRARGARQAAAAARAVCRGGRRPQAARSG